MTRTLLRAFCLALLLAAPAASDARADHDADHVSLMGSHPQTRFLHGDDITVRAELGHDLFAAGERVSVERSTVRDLFLAGRRVSVRDSVGEDLYAAGFDVMVAADLKGGVFGAGAFVDLAGAVAGDAVLAGGRVTLRDDADVAGDALLAGRVLRIGGRIAGDLRAAGQRVIVRGLILGDAVITADELILADGSAVRGTLHHTARSVDIAPGAAVGAVAAMDAPDWLGDRPPGERLWRAVLFGGLMVAAGFVLGLGLVGAAVNGFAPGLATATVDSMQDWPWASLGIGFAAAAGMPLAATLLVMTVVGIPLALLLLAAWFCWMMIATAMAGLWLGLWLRRKATGSLLPPGPFAGFGWLCLGLLALLLIGAVPFAGWLVYWTAVLLALGAMTMEGWSVKRREWGRA